MTRPAGQPPRQSRDAARQRARQMREAAARRRRQQRITLISVALVVVIVVAGAIAWGLTRPSAKASSSSRPPGVTADGGIVTGSASAPHVVTIYQDYQCPYCKAFDQSVGPWLEQQRTAGTTRIEYRVVSFLDRLSSGTKYSSRSANAAACVAADGHADYATFNDALYARQPEEGGTGLSDATITAIAVQSGARSAVGSCINRGTYRDWVTKASDEATSTFHVEGTPTVLVDGTAQKDLSQASLAAALGVAG